MHTIDRDQISEPGHSERSFEVANQRNAMNLVGRMAASHIVITHEHYYSLSFGIAGSSSVDTMQAKTLKD